MGWVAGGEGKGGRGAVIHMAGEESSVQMG